MVNREEILTIFNKTFKTQGQLQVTSQGLVSVKGNVEATTTFDELPVAFLDVTGEFRLGKQPTLQSLVGSPQHVGGDFWVRSEVLESLEGSPHTVGGTFGARSPELKSLDHLPSKARAYGLTWNPHLPMLRLISYKNVKLGYPVKYGGLEAGWKAWKIVESYAGTTNPADVLRCASELNEAGFEGNAEW